MAKKYKLTGCARFLIFLLIVAPLVFFGVSYFQGENPLGQVKDLIQDTSEKIENTTKTKPASSDVEEISILNATIESQKQRIEEQKEKIKELEEKVRKLENEKATRTTRDVPTTKNVGK